MLLSPLATVVIPEFEYFAYQLLPMITSIESWNSGMNKWPNSITIRRMATWKIDCETICFSISSVISLLSLQNTYWFYAVTSYNGLYQLRFKADREQRITLTHKICRKVKGFCWKANPLINIITEGTMHAGKVNWIYFLIK